ncbi:two-component regulator propeller domain-containing protein [Barnesiella viscericola]|uniref:type IX secretion system anionic LPS delivery protein PorZ n=1 Tax=Barnesiella viscericola TaxID=397865 RepID=UPI0025A4A8B3|nr:two-component regulator propeller domain-containing protein [Barnesiella viscericola]MDM8268460.1 two-component regulator propeller domain-containing protein [Barnesiella viscericola]
MSRRISVLIVLIVLSCTFLTRAQLAVGNWQIYSSMGDPVKVIDTGDRVYYVSGISLFCFDKETEEMESYNKNNLLNDIDVANIYYNYDKNYLVVVYANSNIDILYDNGKVYNIPDIKNAIMTSSKAVNDVKFYGNRIYLATDFGIVVLNDEKYEVSESYNYGKKINLIGASSKYWFLISDESVCYIESTATKYSLSNWKVLDSVDGNIMYEMLSFNDKYLLYSKGGIVHFYDITQDNLSLLGTLSMGVRYIDRYYDSFVLRGLVFVAFCKPDIVNGQIQIENVFNFGDQSEYLTDVVTSSYEKDQSIWALGEYGLCHFKMENNQVTMLKELFMPNVLNVANPWNLVINDNKLYVSNSGPRRGTEEQYEKTRMSVLDQNSWTAIDFGELPLVNYKHAASLYSSYKMAFAPDDPNTFYIGTWFEGIYKFTNFECVGHYTTENSPFTKYMNWALSVPVVTFDKEGNLWVAHTGDVGVCMLPKSKLSLSTDQLKVSDWYQFKYADIANNKYAKLLIPKRSTPKWVIYGDWPGWVFAFDDKGTYNTTADDRTRKLVSFTDQDNKSFTPNYYTCIAEDHNGQIWIGTSSGPIVITNPDNVFSDSFRCTRIKIARNDGTDNADYLLQNINITDIFVDGANRKWIGTRESGLYVVSADGSEVLEHFTTENSKLPSDFVTEVLVDPVTGIAYVGTTSGLAAYRSDAVQASEDYSSVYAFPNPVRPDYEGWISVTGLMDNSLVKITDTAGNLFFQGYSNGGQISWDGRDRNGKRVKTGVYLVFASSSASGSQSGVVTKILVVN